jgi:hypothetical protein
MAHQIFTNTGHAVVALAAVANAFAGTVRSTIFNLKNYMGCEFWIHKAVGATGTATITVNACDTTVPGNRTAIPFRYRSQTSSDTWSAVSVATTAGFTTTAGSNQLYEIIIDASEVAKTGFQYVELTSTEVVASAVLGGIIWVGHESNQPQSVPATVLT